MLVKDNFPLKNFNTFGIDVKAQKFIEVSSKQEITEVIQSDLFNQNKVLVLGGGSNILFTQDFQGLIVKISNRGINVVDEDENFVYVSVQGGHNWDEFVDYCVQNAWGGLENLSLIPGQAGASPIQNIGAYGIEVKDVFHSLEAISLINGSNLTFYNDDCKFGYRDSIFKNEHKGKYLISSVVFRLTKKNHKLNLSYGNIEAELIKQNIKAPDIKDVRAIVCKIRNSKLPDVDKIGSAGSFFKNPIISREKYSELIKSFPDMVAFKENEHHYKLAAGWLIDKTGWKAYRKDDAGVYPQQALVLVNFGNARGNQIFELSREIVRSVNNKFGVELNAEVNIH